MSKFTESEVEDAALAWFDGIGYDIAHGPEIAVDGLFAERFDYSGVILEGRLRDALRRLNADLPNEAIESAHKILLRAEGSETISRSRAFHKLLINGVNVEYRTKMGEIKGSQVKVVDFQNPDANDWLAVNQFTIIENKKDRRPDIIMFLNGLPVACLELKNAADEKTDLNAAFKQIQTYKAEIPSLFTYVGPIVISDGTLCRVGTVSSEWERFQPWRTIEGEKLAPANLPELQITIQGLFEKQRFLDMLRYFIVFEDEGGGIIIKKMAGYHQFHAVNLAIEETIRATRDVVRGEANARRLFCFCPAGREAGRSARWRRLAHPRFGQKHHNGVLRRSRHPASSNGKPDHRRAHRPKRS